MTTFNLNKDMGIAPMAVKEKTAGQVLKEQCPQCDGSGTEDSTCRICRKCMGTGEKTVLATQDTPKEEKVAPVEKPDDSEKIVEAKTDVGSDVDACLAYMMKVATADLKMTKTAEGEDAMYDSTEEPSDETLPAEESPEVKKSKAISNIASILFAGDEQKTKQAYTIVANATNVPAASMKTDPSEMRSYILSSLKRIRVEDVEAVLNALRG
jgi:RecJ-like exonuclease